MSSGVRVRVVGTACIAAGLARLLRDEPGFEIVAGETDVILLPVNGEWIACLEAAAVPVVVAGALTAGQLGWSLRHGATGFVDPQRDAPAELAEAVRVAAAGERFLSRSYHRLACQLAAGTRRACGPGAAAEALASLTAREREISALAAAPMSVAEIARRLYISAATVRTHLRRARAKAGCGTRAELLRWVAASIPLETRLAAASGDLDLSAVTG